MLNHFKHSTKTSQCSDKETFEKVSKFIRINHNKINIKAYDK